MKGFYEENLFLRAPNTDVNEEWRPSNIFLQMQEVGATHCEEYNLGMRVMQAQNLAWVVSRARVQMERLPKIGETVTIRTWPKSPQHFFFPRYYQFDVDGETVGRGVSLYVQLDLTSRKMVKPWLGDNEDLTSHLEPSLPFPGGIAMLEAPLEALERTALYSDLDFNGHVNNTRYLDWFGDCFDIDYHRTWQLKDVLIHYNKEVLPDERTELALQRAGAQSVLRGSHEGKPCFAIQGLWEKRA